MLQSTRLLMLAIVFMVIGGNQLMAHLITPPRIHISNYTSPIASFVSTSSSKPELRKAPNAHNHPKFYFGPLELNWFGATVYCQERNWTLIILDSENSRLEFESYLTKYGLRNHRIWTAGNQLVDMKTWRWGLNGPIMTYSHWGRGEPSRSKNRQHCLKLFDKSLSWDDDYCDSVIYFACLKQ